MQEPNDAYEKVYHPEAAFSLEDKTAISRGITEIYRGLPKFYVGVVFQEVPKSSFFVGGEAADDFVRIWVDHIARQFGDEEMKGKFLAAVNRALSPICSSATAACVGKCMLTRRHSVSG